MASPAGSAQAVSLADASDGVPVAPLEDDTSSIIIIEETLDSCEIPGLLRQGDLAATSPLRVLYLLAVNNADGLLVVQGGGVTKEIYFAAGEPQFVSSDDPGERFGEYLVSKNALTEGELART